MATRCSAGPTSCQDGRYGPGCDASDPECAFFLQTVACIKDPASCNGASLDGTEKPASHQSRSTGGGVPGTRFVEGTVAGYLSALAYYLPGEFRETAAVDPTSSWEALRRDPSYATLRDSQKPHLKASVNVCNNVQSAVKNVQYMQTPSSWAWSSGTWFAATGFTATVDAGALPGFPQTTKIVSFTGSEDLGDFLVDASAGFAETITLGGKEYAGNNGFTDEYKSLRAEWLTLSFCDGAPRVLVTGHSLGGAMANYGAVELRNMGCKVDLVTLGAPRAFDDDGWKWRYYRWAARSRSGTCGWATRNARSSTSTRTTRRPDRELVVMVLFSAPSRPRRPALAL